MQLGILEFYHLTTYASCKAVLVNYMIIRFGKQAP